MATNTLAHRLCILVLIILYIIFYSFEFCMILGVLLKQAKIAASKIHSTKEVFFFVFILSFFVSYVNWIDFFKTLNCINFEEPQKLDVNPASFTVSSFLSSSKLSVLTLVE